MMLCSEMLLHMSGFYDYIHSRAEFGQSQACACARCTVPEDAIPGDVKAFIAAHIDSVLLLEILLLLHANPQREWSAADISNELRIDAAWAAGELAKLEAAGVTSVSPGPPPVYRYQARTPELDQTVKGLAREYASRRVTIISMIFAKPLEKIRSFADAFRFRKE